MKQLIHNGVIVPERYKPKGFHIRLNNKERALTPVQEEMAVAWVKKLGTEYVEDKVFVKNFLTDFCNALGIDPNLNLDNYDFAEIIRFVEAERQAKLSMSKEEKKRLTEERKKKREELKEKYGYAIVDGVKVEVSNYIVEPASIFMGRGKHPLRGRWKPAAEISDIILNLSSNAPPPPGNWKEIVWQPDNIWIAKWDDKLRGVEKYVWIADSSFIKQEKEIEKFNATQQLEENLKTLRTHIQENLANLDVKRRKIATVCYLIDALKIRVGDEKDKDEADTIGATTLRPNHIQIMSNNMVKFDFLGKDSIRYVQEITLPAQVVQNLRDFIQGANSSIFQGVRSDVVSEFLGEVVEGVTAKVFRTYYATSIVRQFLINNPIKKEAPEYVKRYTAIIANLQAAVTLNHKKKLPKRWKESLDKKKARLEVLKEKRLQKLRGKKKPSEKTLQRLQASMEKLKLKIEEMKATKEYNLNTSLKSYIDPRIYYEWGKKIDFDWKLYYNKTLQRKFSWVEQTR
ncbi:hypothetical protein [[Eubacterium] cellulosolvens]